MRNKTPAGALSRMRPEPGFCAALRVSWSIALGVALAAGWPAAQAQPLSAVAQVCAACHEAVGSARQPSMPSIAGQPKLFIENQLVLIREGLRDVPAMKGLMEGLSDENIVALARQYAAQTTLPPAGLLQPDKYRAGAEVSRQGFCGTCHLPTYVGQNQVPRLAGQQEDYLVVTMKMYRDNPAPGRDTAMSAVLRGLQDAQLANLAHYFAHFGSQGQLK